MYYIHMMIRAHFRFAHICAEQSLQAYIGALRSLVHVRDKNCSTAFGAGSPSIPSTTTS